MHWTGHALVDVGIAGLCALAGRSEPESLQDSDLDNAAAWMEKQYYSGALTSYLTCVFMNSSFVQPNERPAKRQAFIDGYVKAHRAAPQASVAGQRCAFSGEPATAPLVRTHLPLFSGEGVINFRPEGSTFVPAAGPYIVALMFLPMASRRSEGKLLAVHADDPNLTIRFARRYLEDNQRLLALPLPTTRAPTHPGFDREIPAWDAQKKRYKFADAKGPRSLVMHDLTSIAAEARPSDLRPRPTDVTAYLLSNSGQGPSLDMFHLPGGLVSFVAQAAGASTAGAWEAISLRFRPVLEMDDDAAARGKAKKKRGGIMIAGRAGWTRNPAFEELCGIYDAGFTDKVAAARWLRRHVLGRKDRDEKTKATYERGDARNWKLAELFLMEVLGMKKGRIDAIRGFADKLADHIRRTTDKKLYNALMFDPLFELQHALRRVQRESAGGDLLFGLDEYTNVWLHEDADKFLVRDLICIRVVERLHALGYFASHPEDALPKEDAGSEPEAQEASS